MGKIISLKDRMYISERIIAGDSPKSIAQELGISIPTVRKWKKRFATDGRAGLASRLGRPDAGMLSSFPATLEKQLRQWRESHKGWGAKTLLAELQRHPYWSKESLPGVSAINKWLHEQQLTRDYRKHRELPETANEDLPVYVHEEWEMDARGYSYIPDAGVIALINLNDCFSHARLLSYPCWLGDKRRQRHPTTDDYQTGLRLAFIDWGLPDRLSVDHDSVFYDNDSATPFPTRFHRWLITLGIQLCFGRKGFATDQAMAERSHQLWFHQAIEDQRFEDINHLFDALRERRDFLNNHLPCASLQEQTILQAFPEVRRPRRVYNPQWEESLMDLEKLYNYLAKGKWYRKASKDGTFSMGGQVYYLHKDWKHQTIEITFEKQKRAFICKNEDGRMSKSVALKGNSKDELIGKSGAFNQLKNVQLLLPFSYQEWKVLKQLQHPK